jgi:hypothetical protein
LQFLAAAGGTGRDVGRANKEFELGVTVLAGISVERHEILAA